MYAAPTRLCEWPASMELPWAEWLILVLNNGQLRHRMMPPALTSIVSQAAISAASAAAAPLQRSLVRCDIKAAKWGSHAEVNRDSLIEDILVRE